MTTRCINVSDHSIATMSGSAQALISQDMTRSYLQIFNNGADNLTLTFMAFAAAGGGGGAAGGSIVLVPNGAMTFNTGTIPGNAIQVTGTSASNPYLR